MNVEFYTCSDDPRKISKTMQSVKSAVCTVYDGCSITSPTIMLRYDPDIITCNFFRIPEWNRWYSIADYSVDNAKTLYVTGMIDVLYTYKDQILACDATAIRSEGVGRPTYIPDSSLPLYPESDYVTSLSIGNYAISGNYHYLLTTK